MIKKYASLPNYGQETAKKPFSLLQAASTHLPTTHGGGLTESFNADRQTESLWIPISSLTR